MNQYPFFSSSKNNKNQERPTWHSLMYVHLTQKAMVYNYALTTSVVYHQDYEQSAIHQLNLQAFSNT